MDTLGLAGGPYVTVVAVFALAIFSVLCGGVAYVVVFSVVSGYGARDSMFGPMDASGEQHEWTGAERARFRSRRRLALIVTAVVAVALFIIGSWLVLPAVL